MPHTEKRTVLEIYKFYTGFNICILEKTLEKCMNGILMLPQTFLNATVPLIARRNHTLKREPHAAIENSY